jgi:hypothetical protein
LYSSSNLSVFHIYLSAQQDLRRGTPRASIAPSGWLVEVQIGYNVVHLGTSYAFAILWWTFWWSRRMVVRLLGVLRFLLIASFIH